MIRVGKYDYKTKQEAKTKGFTNVLIHTEGPLSPYQMKDDDGIIMENYWQFSKIWESVDYQKQSLSQYNPNVIRWEYPNQKEFPNKKKELHFINGEPTSEYWIWRNKGFHHNRWVRYPNGFKNHKDALGSVIGTPENYRIVDYITARKEIYYPKYREIAEKTEAFDSLKTKLKFGENIQINEVDGPTFIEKDYPYNKVEYFSASPNGSLLMSEEILNALINNPVRAFGHGYSLAAALMGIIKFE